MELPKWVYCVVRTDGIEPAVLKVYFEEELANSETFRLNAARAHPSVHYSVKQAKLVGK